MFERHAQIVGAAFLMSFVTMAYAQDRNSVHIPDQTIPIRTRETPNITGSIRGGEYAGVQFLAEPDASTPLPAAYQPQNLLTKLDPSLQVEGVGMPGADRPMDIAEIRSALPNTMFRLKVLISSDGQTAVELKEHAVVVYVSGYKTSRSRSPSLDDIVNMRLEKYKHVFINDYVVTIADLPSCHILSPRLCDTQK